MMNTNYRELNIDELAMVAGGIRVKTNSEASYEEIPTSHEFDGIPRGGKVSVRV
jgi:hypothetical protein